MNTQPSFKENQFSFSIDPVTKVGGNLFVKREVFTEGCTPEEAINSLTEAQKVVFRIEYTLMKGSKEEVAKITFIRIENSVSFLTPEDSSEKVMSILNSLQVNSLGLDHLKVAMDMFCNYDNSYKKTTYMTCDQSSGSEEDLELLSNEAVKKEKYFSRMVNVFNPEDKPGNIMFECKIRLAKAEVTLNDSFQLITFKD
jgi:hypothetical protein